MAYNYSSLAATAKRLIDKFGTDAQVRRYANSGTEWSPTQVATDYACTAVLTSYNANEIDGTVIQRGDRKALVAASLATVIPTVSDKLVMDGNEIEIVNVKTLKPGSTTILWEIQARI